MVDEASKVAKGDEAEGAAVRAAAVGRNARRGRVRDDTAHAGGAQEGHQVSSLPRPCSSGDVAKSSKTFLRCQIHNFCF